jgi:polysaccharide biosynthesis transport protein
VTAQAPGLAGVRFPPIRYATETMAPWIVRKPCLAVSPEAMVDSGECAVQLGEYLDILRRRWLGVLIVALATLALASAVTLAMPKKYTATTRLFFGVAAESVSDLAQGSNFAEKQMASFAEVATSPRVLVPVIQQLDLRVTPQELTESVEASVRVNTVILEIAATDRDPTRAAQIANAVGSELAKAAADLSPERQDGTEAVQVNTIAGAEVPTEASSPKVPQNLSIGLILGLLLGVGMAVLRHVLDTKIRNENDVRILTGSPILGVVAYDQDVPSHPVILRDEPLAAPSEAVRRLRTNLQFIDVANRPKSIVVSSSIPAEGKTTIAINLAVSLADAGARVILVDADLRRPSIAEYLHIEGGVGLTTVLIGRADVKDVVQPFGTTSLDVLPAGQVPPNPSELLGSVAMADLLERLSASYDMVLLDSPPLLPVTDAVVLSKLAGGALVVVGADRIHRPELQQSLDSLETAGAHLFGIVMNKIARRDASAYAYDSGYASYEPKIQRSAPIQPKRGWNEDDTLISRERAKNGHKSATGRVR